MPITTVTEMCKLKSTPSHPSLKSTNDHLQTSTSKSKITKTSHLKKPIVSKPKKKIRHSYLREFGFPVILINELHVAFSSEMEQIDEFDTL